DPGDMALLGADGHVAWVNQRALDLAGITRGTPDPPGGTIVRDPDGSPTGLLKDDALYAVTRQIPGPEGDRLHTACARMFARAAAQGVTSFLDAACTDWELGVYAALASSGRLPQRIATALRLDPEEVADPPEALSWLRDARKEFGDIPKVSVRTAKVFLDGVIEHPTQSAALIDPYLDGDGRLTGRRGDLFADAAAFGRLAVLLDRHGFQLHAHAIGDRAVRTALDGYERALRANGPRGNRHTVAHLQLVHPDDLPRFARLGVVACMQLQWAVRNAWTVDALLPYLGERRHRLLYPARSLERHGAVLAGGSDWPVDPLAVWNQIRTAVDREGTAAEQGALHPGLEGLARAAALRMHTEGAARQLRIDHRVGRLTPGRAADLIVLDRDVTRIPVREIGDTQVRLTLVGGRTVFDAETEEGKAVRADSVLSSLGSSAPPVSSASPASPVSAASAVSPASAGPGPYADRHRACGCPRTAGRGTTARL
uniref:amidohydrolase n=1 Tax=Streptomyces clavuligerus TaxID=1901 RepID=UPI0018D01759